MIHDRPGVRLDTEGMAKLLQSREVGDAMVDAGYRVESTAQSLYPKQVFDTRRRQVATLSPRYGGTSRRAGAEVSTLPEHWGRLTPSVDALQQAAKRSRSG